MASTHASRRRLKFAIEFAAIGQAEIEGWLSYFEDMDVNELGAARSRRLEVLRCLPCDSCPSHDAGGGFFFDFDAPRRRTRSSGPFYYLSLPVVLEV